MLLALIYFINTVLSYFGIKVILLNYIGSVSLIPLAFLYISSYVFRYCEYHRMFLHYIIFNDILDEIDYYAGIPLSDKQIFSIRLIFVCISLFLILYAYAKVDKKIALAHSR